MLVTSIFSQCFPPIPKRISVFKLNSFCRLQMLSIWISLKICRLVKSRGQGQPVRTAQADQGPYQRTILQNVLRLVLKIFQYLEASECNTTSDWLNHIQYGLANQKLCYIQIPRTLRKRQRMFLKMVGENKAWIDTSCTCDVCSFNRAWFIFIP